MKAPALQRTRSGRRLGGKVSRPPHSTHSGRLSRSPALYSRILCRGLRVAAEGRAVLRGHPAGQGEPGASSIEQVGRPLLLRISGSFYKWGAFVLRGIPSFWKLSLWLLGDPTAKRGRDILGAAFCNVGFAAAIATTPCKKGLMLRSEDFLLRGDWLLTRLGVVAPIGTGAPMIAT